ncbi:acyl-CoA reductase-like NAD-dependent aldehyde dehydrogenase [Spinactinospora alkalitolerans]|uniref:aldehyde dehydrogenase (NAD(+)) n=1 Tax=Spinactinospora alkalitolerans TaxID=687207 RepID=A0A852TRX8_9ACTN|nr:aldehyde dehydrogenase [Spinactinospora alkalitolerans]NYE47146.1 acyl-CoA reductase-like NAD-dependent aldehyde dehydrogenase [Spinactinospora alkalitolerans]
MSDGIDRDALYIDGDWRKPSTARTFTAVSAATEQPIGVFPEADRTDVDTAVAAARRALGGHHGWGSAKERAAAMERLALALEARTDALGTLIAQEVGTPLARAIEANVSAATGLLRFYAPLADVMYAEDLRPALVGHSLVRREPVGVAAMIVPWNYPLSTLFFKLAPALAMGCTAVIKPSPATGLDSFLVADAVHEAGFPPGVINFLPAEREVGEYLVTHPGVDKVAFTGSTSAGRRIGALCGELLRPVTLELGGKSAAILLEDAPLPLFLDHLLNLSFNNNGQTCTNNTRLLVPRSRYEEIVDAVTATVASWPVGDPLDPSTVIGPVAGAAARDRIEGYLRKGRQEGARVTTGGGRPSGRDCGFYVEPTVFADVDPAMTIAREEIFGPVVTISAHDGSVEDAVTMAEDSAYGLAGSVWTADETLGRQVARAVDTGTISVNHANFDIGAPLSGRRESGLGSELGREGIEAYLQYKTIFVSEPPADSDAPAT